MEVVTIEERTFSYVCERFTEFAKRIESLCSTHAQKVENWLSLRKRGIYRCKNTENGANQGMLVLKNQHFMPKNIKMFSKTTCDYIFQS